LARRPSLDRKLSRLVAAMESQAPFRRALASPQTPGDRVSKPGVIEFAERIAGPALRAFETVCKLAHAQPNHPVVDAVVAVDQFDQCAASVDA
jgi:hypothetical protein